MATKKSDEPQPIAATDKEPNRLGRFVKIHHKELNLEASVADSAVVHLAAKGWEEGPLNKEGE